MSYKLYKIVNLVNNKNYIGKTTQTLEERWLDHCQEAKRWQNCKNCGTEFGYNSKLYPAIAKHGITNFQISLLEEVNNLEELNQREKHWIALLDTRHCGYNIAAGGDGGFFFGCHHTAEAKEKIRSAALNRTHTPETRSKISKSKLGHTTSTETREKIRKTKTGVKFGAHTPEWNKHISEGHLNEVICIDANMIYRNIKEAALQTGINRSAISNCVGGFAKTAGGFKWQYLNKKF